MSWILSRLWQADESPLQQQTLPSEAQPPLSQFSEQHSDSALASDSNSLGKQIIFDQNLHLHTSPNAESKPLQNSLDTPTETAQIRRNDSYPQTASIEQLEIQALTTLTTHQLDELSRRIEIARAMKVLQQHAPQELKGLSIDFPQSAFGRQFPPFKPTVHAAVTSPVTVPNPLDIETSPTLPSAPAATAENLERSPPLSNPPLSNVSAASQIIATPSNRSILIQSDSSDTVCEALALSPPPPVQANVQERLAKAKQDMADERKAQPNCSNVQKTPIDDRIISSVQIDVTPQAQRMPSTISKIEIDETPVKAATKSQRAVSSPAPQTSTSLVKEYSRSDQNQIQQRSVAKSSTHKQQGAQLSDKLGAKSDQQPPVTRSRAANDAAFSSPAKPYSKSSALNNLDVDLDTLAKLRAKVRSDGRAEEKIAKSTNAYSSSTTTSNTAAHNSSVQSAYVPIDTTLADTVAMLASRVTRSDQDLNPSQIQAQTKRRLLRSRYEAEEDDDFDHPTETSINNAERHRNLSNQIQSTSPLEAKRVEVPAGPKKSVAQSAQPRPNYNLKATPNPAKISERNGATQKSLSEEAQKSPPKNPPSLVDRVAGAPRPRADVSHGEDYYHADPARRGGGYSHNIQIVRKRSRSPSPRLTRANVAAGLDNFKPARSSTIDANRERVTSGESSSRSLIDRMSKPYTKPSVHSGTKLSSYSATKPSGFNSSRSAQSSSNNLLSRIK